MPSPKLTEKQIAALVRLRDVVMQYKVDLTNSLSEVGLEDKAPWVLRPPIQAILAALAECEEDVD
jgi:hypothetical protein